MFQFLVDIINNRADGTIMNDADGPGSEVILMKMRKGTAVIRPEIIDCAAVFHQERAGIGIERIACRIIGVYQVFFFKVIAAHFQAGGHVGHIGFFDDGQDFRAAVSAGCAVHHGRDFLIQPVHDIIDFLAGDAAGF